ncbi:IPT/TIG domain-containing protein [Actinoplanes sp. NPDC049681]|uniref:IPT/TIG domain-containing protein n=1 Tax=Actinoplanes sp. NPDC049681 TaxID=3363905 RepID=UPI00379F7D65
MSIGLLLPGLAAPADAAAKPVLTKLTPSSGPLRQIKLTLRGSNLRGVSAVRFGNLPGVVVGRSTATSVTVRTPRSARPATVSVRVKTPAGWSAVSKKVRYTFVAAPTLSRISPTSGYFSGGTRVTLSGKRFETTRSVHFGTQRATILSRRAGVLVVRSPIGVLGKVAVTVTTAGGATRGRGLAFEYVQPPAQSSLELTPASGAFVAADVEWVTGGYHADTGVAEPWLVGLPKGSTAPAVGRQFVLRPGDPAFPSGLAGTVTEVADQLDGSVRVTVAPSDLEGAVDTLSLDYAGPVGAPPAARAAAVEVGKAFEFSVTGPTSLFCQDPHGQAVSFGADLTSTVTDVDVDQHLDLGGLVRRPRYDAAFTGEVQTTGKITVGAAATCKIKEAWANAHRRVIPLGTSGSTLSFGPAFEFKISGKGTWSITDRTRTTFAVNAVLGSKPTYSRTARSVDSKQGGELSFEAEVTGGVSVQFGLLDRAGLQGKVLLGVSAALRAVTAPNVCVEGEVFLKLTVGVFLDALVKRWEADAFAVKLTLFRPRECVISEPPAPSGEPEITSARLPDASVGVPYAATLGTADGRPGTWSVVRFGLPAGLALAADGAVSGVPQGPVGDFPVIVDFKDASGRVTTTTIRIMVRPGPSLGGGDIQATLRWSGAADLDLHVLDPSGEEIYYGHATSESGGRLDHDANAACNGIEDDDNAVENVYWPTGAAPGGSYSVWVKVYNACDAPVDWHLSVRRNGTLVVDEDGTGDSSAYTFSLGSASARAAAVRVVAPPVSKGGRKR